MCLNIGTPYNHHFPFGTYGKVVVLGVPILKHFRVNRNEESHTRESHTRDGEPFLSIAFPRSVIKPQRGYGDCCATPVKTGVMQLGSFLYFILES